MTSEETTKEAWTFLRGYLIACGGNNDPNQEAMASLTVLFNHAKIRARQIDQTMKQNFPEEV